jgi:glutamine synthetase
VSVLERTALDDLIQTGQVDTVILAFPDQQGRLLGKRLTGRHFREHVADGGIHACDYLLTVDVEMEPLPGFRVASWERGYGDFRVVPDWSTARRLPWLDGTALLLGDLQDSQRHPVSVAPRQVLHAQVERAAARGLRVKLASELECYLFRDSFAGAGEKGYRGLARYGAYLEDYHLLQGTREEPILRRLRNAMETAGVPMEGTKGEWGRGQTELNLAYADAMEMADRHTLLKHAAKEIAEQAGASVTFMAKPAAAEAGSSCHIHTSVWDAGGEHNLFWNDSQPGGGPSRLFEQFLAGQLALARDLALFYAPTVNSYKRYQSLSWAPTAITWGQDNRTCGFRVVGHGDAFRCENRLPGADVNPYLAFAATIAAGLYGIERELSLPPVCQGNAYLARDVPRLPATIREAIAALEGSAVAREILGEDVVEHYLLTATHEAAAFERAVTDWEVRRYFERM